MQFSEGHGALGAGEKSVFILGFWLSPVLLAVSVLIVNVGLLLQKSLSYFFNRHILDSL